MKPSLQRAIRSAQIKMRMIAVNVDGSAGAPVASGFDASQIKEIVKNGAGDHTIILKTPFDKDNATLPMAWITPVGGAATVQVTAAAYDRVTVLLSADVDFSILILGQDFRFNH